MRGKHLNRNLMIFVLPALVFYCIFMVGPILGGLYYSFTDWNGLGDNPNFIGLENYIKIFKDQYFLESIGFTFKYTVAVVLILNVLAIALAMLVENRKRSKGFFRTVMFMPNMISLIISSFVWAFIFSKVIPEFAEKYEIGFLNISWLGDPNNSFWAIMIVSAWARVGYIMLIYTAGIQSVPNELKEAARIDGASGWQVFKSVILPLIIPSMTICIFITLNWGFKAFDISYALTNGGPGRATETMALNIYNEAFSDKLRYAYANAKAIILVLVMLVIAGTQVIMMKRKEVEA